MSTRQRITKLLLLLALFCGFTLGGTIAWADTIYLKNGSIIKGKITETAPGVSYKIETRDGNIFVFKMEEIEKVIFVEEEEDKEKSVIGKKIRFSIIPFLGSWEPEDLEERDLLWGINCRWRTEKDVAFQLEYAHWSHSEAPLKGSWNIIGLSGLYFIKPKTVPTIFPYIGGGLGFYFWHAEPYEGWVLLVDEDDSGIGFHICGGAEFLLKESFVLGLELRQIVTGETSGDWEIDFTGLIFGGKAVFTF